eukprot:RCo042336
MELALLHFGRAVLVATCVLGYLAEAFDPATLLLWTNAVNVIVGPGSIQRNGQPTPPLNWTAGAQSVAPMEGVGLTVMAPAELVCGLTLERRPFTTSFNALDYALRFTATGFVNVVERGLFKTLVGQYADGDTFKIIRTHAAKVRYYWNDRLVYESNTVWVGLPLSFWVTLRYPSGGLKQVHFSPANPQPALDGCWSAEDC